MTAPSQILRFNGPVTWLAGPGRAGITLVGKIVEADGSTTTAQLSLSCRDTPQLPPSLDEVTFEALTAPEMLLRSGAQEWRLRGNTWQLHRDVGAMFYAAVPPRTTPWSRKFSWSVLLGLAAIGPGRWLLGRLGRAK